MELEFPNPNQLLTQYCFLTPMDGHERILQDLNSAVLLYSIAPIPQLNKTLLSRLLVERYGGSPNCWRIRRVPRGFLIYLPSWLYNDEFYLDSSFWERQKFLPQPWQALNGSEPLPDMHRVHLTILDFPIDFWHPFYFREALASMGIVRGVQRECLNGDDSTAVRLWLDSPDLQLIPFQLIVGHDGRWTTCQILLDGRLDSNPDYPPPPPPHSPESDDSNGPLPIQDQNQLDPVTSLLGGDECFGSTSQ